MAVFNTNLQKYLFNLAG